MKKIEQMPDELRPCGHMTDLVSQRSDDSLKGPARWYTDFHIATCPRCKAALEGLRKLHREVQELSAEEAAGRLSNATWEKIESGCVGVENSEG